MKGFQLMFEVRWIIGLLLIGLVGCGGGGDTSGGVEVEDVQSFRSASMLYDKYQKEHRGKTPPDEQAFRAFIESQQEILQRINKTADDLLKSPRTGEPLVFVYGKKPPMGPGGMTYFAYEKTPVDGRRLVIASRGFYEEMDEAQFKKFFPDAS
jgi:hypothetical protein